MERRKNSVGSDVDVRYALIFPAQYSWRKSVDYDDTLYIIATDGRMYIIEDYI